MSVAASSRARNKIRQWFQRETKGETEAKGREALDQALKAQNLPYRKLQGSAVLAEVIRDLGFKKAEDFYLAVGSGKLGTGQVVNKVLQRLKTDQVAEEPAVTLKPPKARSTVAGDSLGIVVQGVDDVLIRLAKCCTPVPGDEIKGYISLGRGITIHRADCPNVKALMRNPERFTPVEWEGSAKASFRVQIAVDAWDRARLLEDVARTFAEHGANIVAYGGTVEDGMAKNWYTPSSATSTTCARCCPRCATWTRSSTPTESPRIKGPREAEASHRPMSGFSRTSGFRRRAAAIPASPRIASRSASPSAHFSARGSSSIAACRRAIAASVFPASASQQAEE
jgi:GTP pyrophosphokinase